LLLRRDPSLTLRALTLVHATFDLTSTTVNGPLTTYNCPMPQDTLHILNGESTLAVLEKTSLSGKMFSWPEMFFNRLSNKGDLYGLEAKS
jgi:hypothetical protein